VKLAAALLLSFAAMAQSLSRTDAMRPWLEGRFAEAERAFARSRSNSLQRYLFWEAEFEIERGRFGQAAALIEEGKHEADRESYNRRRARLLLSIGRYAEAEKLSLAGSRWDRNNPGKLNLPSPMEFVNLGEVMLAKGDFSTALPILTKGGQRARKSSSFWGTEWVRAQNGVALAQLALGSVQEALKTIMPALASAEAEWGAKSVPAMDLLDTLGVVQTAAADYDMAGTSLQLSCLRRQELYRPDHPKLVASYMHAARLYSLQKKSDEALRILQHALELDKLYAVGPNGRLALNLLDAAEIYASAGRIEDATSCYASALPILEGELGANAPRVANARIRQAMLAGM